MLDGKAAVFISCSERYKERVAYPFRDLLERLGTRPIIVADAPKLMDAWTPEDKIEEYLNRADVMLALCTPDNQLTDGTCEPRPNIIDELSRARSKAHLRDRVCVLKERSVTLASNINPVYDSLDVDDLRPAICRFLAQLRTWGFRVSDAENLPQEVTPTEPSLAEGIIMELRPEEFEQALSRVRQLFREWTKQRQREFVAEVMTIVRSSQQWEMRAAAGHVFEAVVELDPGLMPVDILDELSRHADFAVRSSAAVALFILASETPGTVPVDIVARLAQPTTQDWYTYTPALNALKQLSLTRPEAVAAIVALAQSPSRDVREAAATALLAAAKVRASVVPPDIVAALCADEDQAVRRIASEAQGLVMAVPEDERQHPYSPFCPF